MLELMPPGVHALVQLSIRDKARRYEQDPQFHSHTSVERWMILCNQPKRNKRRRPKHRGWGVRKEGEHYTIPDLLRIGCCCGGRRR